jgi:hypothetical protein
MEWELIASRRVRGGVPVACIIFHALAQLFARTKSPIQTRKGASRPPRRLRGKTPANAEAEAMDVNFKPAFRAVKQCVGPRYALQCLAQFSPGEPPGPFSASAPG